MKLLTIAVPCKNSSEYMKKCIDSLLIGGDDVEIIIVDNDSQDNTKEIAQQYVREYPAIVRCVSQPDSGVGGAINTGLNYATGLYFKVVDSQDSVDPDGYRRVLNTLKNLIAGGCMIDMSVTNVVHEKPDTEDRKVVRYATYLPKDQLFDWNDIKTFKPGRCINMYALIYRTQLLRECHMVLPRFTSYVENLMGYIPLPYVCTIYYHDVEFYRCNMDKKDQILKKDMDSSKIDQHISVNMIMADAYHLNQITSRNLKNYMFNYLEIVTTLSTMVLDREGTHEALEKKKNLWLYIKEFDPRTYKNLRNKVPGRSMNQFKKNTAIVGMAVIEAAQKVRNIGRD